MNVRYDWYGLVYWIFLLATEPTGSSISNVLQAAEHNISTVRLHTYVQLGADAAGSPFDLYTDLMARHQYVSSLRIGRGCFSSAPSDAAPIPTVPHTRVPPGDQRALSLCRDDERIHQLAGLSVNQVDLGGVREERQSSQEAVVSVMQMAV